LFRISQFFLVTILMATLGLSTVAHADNVNIILNAITGGGITGWVQYTQWSNLGSTDPNLNSEYYITASNASIGTYLQNVPMVIFLQGNPILIQQCLRELAAVSAVGAITKLPYAMKIPGQTSYVIPQGNPYAYEVGINVTNACSVSP
jgi:hypothetical protein